MSAGRTVKKDQLQFLRFLAFLIVFTYHAGFFNDFSSQINGAGAVTFFFVLSGFLAGYRAKNAAERPNLKKCWLNAWKLIRKVYPLYLLTTLAALSYSDILNTIAYHNFSGFQGPPEQFVRSLLLIQSWFPEGYFAFNGVAWFLSALLFLKFIELPVIHYLGRLGKGSKRTAFFALLAANAVYCFSVRNLNPEFWLYVFPPCRMFEYFASVLLGISYGGWESTAGDPAHKKRTASGIAEAAALLIWLSLAFVKGPQWLTRDLIWIIPCMALVAVFALGNGALSKLFSSKAPVYLGDISFECYLIHQVLINIFLAMCHIRGVSRAGDLLGYVMTLFMTVLAAAVIHGIPGRKKERS